MDLTETRNHGTSIPMHSLMIHHTRLQETPLSTLRDTEYWRKRAQEARAEAEQMSSPEDKRDLMDIARAYEQLAELAAAKKLLGE
jgi:hypothetical protein